MIYPYESRKTILQIAVGIAIILNGFKLFSLMPGSVIARFWNFNLTELIYEFALTALFNYLILRMNLQRSSVSKSTLLLLNLVTFGSFYAGGLLLQKWLFNNTIEPLQFHRGIALMKFLSSFALCILFIRQIKISEIVRLKSLENERLQKAIFQVELESLREQLDPHFLFNALSGLMGVIKENPDKAQRFVVQLSKILRFTLSSHNKTLVTLKEEMALFNSYAFLSSLRMEDKLEIASEFDLPDDFLIPPMTLQILLENAIKHNALGQNDKLIFSIKQNQNQLEITNNITRKVDKSEGFGIGLSNLEERCKILMGRSIQISSNPESFTVIVPLKFH